MRYNIPFRYFVKKKDVNIEDLWDMKRKPEAHLALIEEIADYFVNAINNHYDIVTTPRPSKTRDPKHYAVYMIADAVARKTGLTHEIIFEQSKTKKYHGFHHPASEEPIQIKKQVTGKAILLIDDVYNSGETLKIHRQALIDMKNCVDCMVYCNYDS